MGAALEQGSPRRWTILQVSFSRRPMFEGSREIRHLEKTGGRQHVVAQFRRRSHKELSCDREIYGAEGRTRPARVTRGHDGIRAGIEDGLYRIGMFLEHGRKDVV